MLKKTNLIKVGRIEKIKKRFWAISEILLTRMINNKIDRKYRKIHYFLTTFLIFFQFQFEFPFCAPKKCCNVYID
jgi:hypothetical protein